MEYIGGDGIMNYPIVSLSATGDNIRRLRKERKVKTSELADYLGFSVGTWRMFTNIRKLFCAK